MGTHVIVGAGAVGTGTALRLAADGHQVRVITRSGSGPSDPAIELVAADASDERRLTELAQGADALYNCANPPYHRWATDWPPLASSLLHAAEATGARLVTMSNLYGYAADSSPMAATDPLDPPSKKGAIRTAMWNDAIAAHRSGGVRVTEARASDYFGPGIGENGHFGDRAIPRLLKGKAMSVIGRPDVPHSWSYIGDVCDTLVVLGTDDRALGRAWHVPTGPPLTAQELATAVSEAAGKGAATVKSLPNAVIRLAGLFSKQIRELPEMRYQFVAPFVIDADDTMATFGLQPTPLDQQIAATIESYGHSASTMTRTRVS